MGNTRNDAINYTNKTWCFVLSPHVEKVVPRGYQLMNGWKISQKGIKYLRTGPLISESGETILVQPYGFLSRIIVRFERPITFFGSIASILALIWVFI